MDASACLFPHCRCWLLHGQKVLPCISDQIYYTHLPSASYTTNRLLFLQDSVRSLPFKPPYHSNLDSEKIVFKWKEEHLRYYVATQNMDEPNQ